MPARKTLAAFVSESTVRDLASERSFSRGVDYFQGGAVSRLRATDREITSEVLGSNVYRTRLWVDKRALDWDCTCPVGQEGDFCKHLVATGLAWLARGREDPDNAKPPADLEAIRTWLERADKATLVELLLRQAECDETLAADLLTKAQDSGLSDTRAIKEAIRKAFPAAGFVDYYGMRGAYTRAAPIAALLQALLKRDPAAAFESAGYAAKLGLNALDHGDDSDGLLGGVVADIAAVHREAAPHAGVGAPVLAKSVFDLQMADGYGFFELEPYAATLGRQGLAAYRELAERAWKAVPEREPGARDRDETSARAQITGIMKALARRDGNVDALVEVLRRDLSNSYAYLEIAEALARAGRHDDALAWAEAGHRAFANELHFPLEDFLVHEYHRRERYDEALAIRWARFVSHPSLTAYQSLKESADHAQNWQHWREQALTRLRSDKSENGHRYGPDVHGLSATSLLVQIFLWERDPEAALAQARTGGCSIHLWLDLAKALEAKQPAEAIVIYQAQVDPIVNRTNNQAYDEAAELLRKIRDLMAVADRSAEFSEYLATLRARHRAKRNFMQRLDGLVAERSGGGHQRP